MIRKALAGVGAATALALALTACSSGSGGASDDASTAAGPVELSVAVWSMDQTPEFTALFDAFEAKYPDITIKPVDILADDYPEKVTTMLAGGDTTDVITMKTLTDYSRYAGRGQLEDVTDLVTDYPDGKLAGTDGYQVDDQYFAVPYRQDFWVLYYNKGIFDAAGVPYPDHITWDQYADLAQQLTGTMPTGEKQYGTYTHVWRSVTQAIAQAQEGGDLLSGDYGFLKDQYDLNVGLQKDGYALDYATAKTNQTSYRTMFETQATAMMPMGTWYISGILQAKKDGKSTVDWGIAPMPQTTAGGDTTTFGGPTAFAVNKASKHKDAAKKFLAFAASLDGAKAISAIGVVPALQSDEVTTAYFGLDGMPTDELSKQAFAPDDVTLEMAPSDQTADISTILDEEHDLIMVGEKSVDDGIAEMESRVKDEVLD